MRKMEELSERQKLLLTLIIHEYIVTASPVGSGTLVEHYRLSLSSATVRNELSALTEMGYLRQPHTSAGRVPTEEGYRYFVSRLVQDTSLSDSARSTISHQFYQSRNDLEQWMRLSASVLANQSRAASLVTAPHPEKAQLKHVELISTRGRQVLMVLVMIGGEINQRMQLLTEPVSQEALSSAAANLSTLFAGLSPDQISAIQSRLSGLEHDIAGWIIEEMSRVASLVSGEIYLDGLTNMLAEPEFADSSDARRALHILEERPLLEDFLSRTMSKESIGGVQVLIGGEGQADELSQCSLILSRYGTPGLATGMLGILGPMRMPYGRSISVVRFVSSLLSDMVTETLVAESE